MKFDLKHTIIFSQDKDLDIISTVNTIHNKNTHNSTPTDVYIKHDTGFIICDNIYHGNIKVGSKTFYNTFLETPHKTPTILGQNTASLFLEFINIDVHNLPSFTNYNEGGNMFSSVDLRDIVAAWNVGNNSEVFVNTVSEASDADSTELQVEDIRRLHVSLGHIGADSLHRSIAIAKKDFRGCKAIVEQVTDSCKICMQYRKKPGKKRAALPKSYNVNEKVSIDLKIMSNGKYILWMVDEFSRFIKGTVINDKRGETIVDAIWNSWVINGMGHPKVGFHSDNGNEFTNSDFLAMCDHQGIKLSTTSSYSPYQNGLNEKRHALADIVIGKLQLENPTWPLQKLVDHAAFVRNQEVNRTGFSSAQIVYGSGSFHPGLSDEYTPEFTTALDRSSIVRENISKLEKVRTEFRAADMNNRLKLAAKNRVPSTQYSDYQVNDQCGFWNAKDHTWGKGKINTIDNHHAMVTDEKNSTHKVGRNNLRPIPGNAWSAEDLEPKVTSPPGASEPAISTDEQQNKGNKDKVRKVRRQAKVTTREERITRSRANTEDQIEDLFKGNTTEPAPTKRKKKVKIVVNNKKYNTRLSSTEAGTDDDVFDEVDCSDVEQKLLEVKRKRNSKVTFHTDSPVNSRTPWIQGNTGLPREGQLVQVQKADGHEIIGRVHRLPRPGSSSRNMVLNCELTGNRETVDSSSIRYRTLDENIKGVLSLFKRLKR